MSVVQHSRDQTSAARARVVAAAACEGIGQDVADVASGGS